MDTEIPLEGLVEYLLDHVNDKCTRYEMVFEDWDVSGRKGNHKMEFTLKLRAKIDGKTYVLSEDYYDCYENGTLTVDLPEAGLTLSA